MRSVISMAAHSFDHHCSSFQRFPASYKVHVFQKKASDARKFLKWLATTQHRGLGPASAPPEGGYGYRDTHSKNFGFIKRDILLNFDNNNDVYQVPIHFQKRSIRGPFCCDDSSAIILLFNPFYGMVEESYRTACYMDEHFNGSGSFNRRPILVLFTAWERMVNYSNDLFPGKPSKYDMGSFFRESVVETLRLWRKGSYFFAPLPSRTMVYFGICPADLNSQLLASYATDCVRHLISEVIMEHWIREECEDVSELITVLQKEMSASRWRLRSSQNSESSGNDTDSCSSSSKPEEANELNKKENEKFRN